MYQLIDHPRPGTPEYFIALAQEATRFCNDNFGLLLRRGDLRLTLDLDTVGRVTYFVLKVEDADSGRILAYSYTSSRQELGMDVDEFAYDYFRDDEEEAL